jgi:LemA protein
MGRVKGRVAVSVIFLILVYLFVRHANNLFVEEQHLLFTASGLLEVEIKRKQSLIAKNVEAIQQYSKLEEKIQRHLIDLNAATNPPGNNSIRLEKSNVIFELFSELDNLKERYPMLKADNPYMVLMRSIQSSGLRVINARLAYNRKVAEYNTYLKVFPYKLVAKILGFNEQPFQEGIGEKYLRNSSIN